MRSGMGGCKPKQFIGGNMKSDFDMIMHRLSPDLKNIIVYPVSDLHDGDAYSNTRLWYRFKNHVLSQDNAFITIQGDMTNNALKNSKSNVYQATKSPREQKIWLRDELRDLRERILCIEPGNHESRSTKETDDCLIYDIACQLNIEHLYRPNTAFINIKFGKRRSLDQPASFNIMAMHGSGGGGQTGASINKIARVANYYENVDIVIMGHVHRNAVERVQKLILNTKTGKVYTRDQLHVISAPFQEYGGYALNAMLSPSSTSRQPIELIAHSEEFKVTI